MLKNLIEKARLQPAVKNNLLREEHVTYLLYWQNIIGKQERVVYNAMGPDVSTVLLLTDANEIIGIDPKAEFYHTPEYIHKYWHLIDKKPIYRAGAFWYSFEEENTAESLELKEHYWEDFKRDFEFRKEHGYWDLAHMNRWDLDRLLMIELKKLDIDPNQINFNPDPFKIYFKWPYPGEQKKDRKIIYLDRRLDDLSYEFGKIDCFYQKSLPTPGETLKYIKMILPFLSEKANIFIGHVFDYNLHWDDNNHFCKEIQETLGDEFVHMPATKDINDLIDDIPDVDGDPYNQYGMKLHAFKREK